MGLVGEKGFFLPVTFEEVQQVDLGEQPQPGRAWAEARPGKGQFGPELS